MVSTKSLESQLTSTQSLITSNAKSIATLTEQNRLTQAQIQPIKDTANIFTAKLSSLAAARSVMNSDLHQVIALKPPTVTVTGVTHSGSAMTITGSSAKQDEVLAYAQALRDTGGFNVVVTSISYSSEITEEGVLIPSYSFSFQMK